MITFVNPEEKEADRLSVVIADLQDAYKAAQSEHAEAVEFVFQAQKRADMAQLHVDAIGKALRAIEDEAEKFAVAEKNAIGKALRAIENEAEKFAVADVDNVSEV